MTKKENTLEKGWRLLTERIEKRGIGVTMKWIAGRGWTYFTGLPLLAHSQITPLIFVGPQLNQAGAVKVQEEGIVASVNMRIEHDDAAFGEDLPHYCYVPLIDDDAPSMTQIQQGVAFITEQVAQNHPVYIHCKGGIGRAPTMAACYFISTGMTLKESIALIEKTRPYINVMPIQLMQLKRYERLLANRKLAGERVRIQKAHKNSFDYPFDFYNDTPIKVLESDKENLNWKKCRLADGTEGWVPETAIEETQEGWRTIQDYSALEMDVEIGEEIIVYEELFGWAWAEKDTHEHGWIPIECYRPSI
jgi:protein-tyrosine phosphatase